VDVVLEGAPGEPVALAPEPDGYFAALVPDARAGSRYRYRLDTAGEPLADPASRCQPEGPHGPSEVVDPGRFAWTDTAWPGVALPGQVIYEMHVGTFTPEGTWQAAARQLPAIAALGVTVLEIMPVADFPGRFGWGYDGVALFAPTRLYGTPDDFRRFVDRAHGLGLGVILDVVYNHVGPDGCVLKAFSPRYFSDRYDNEWGEPINFDGPGSGPVRELFVANAGYWIDEFHLDGLRLDATQQIFDRSPEHVLAAIGRRVRAAAGARATIVVAENEPQDVSLVRPVAAGGQGLDALWNDDFHHAARVAVTGRNEAYYTDYQGRPQELVAAVKRGFLYQGQHYAWQDKPRGTPTRGVEPWRLVTYLQNHDQVANSGRGERLHEQTTPGRYRAITALALLAPGTPMLFQGQEFAASSPFLYFADHRPGLARPVGKGRREFLAQFPSLSTPEMAACLAEPGDPETFARCKLDPGERDRHGTVVALHRDLLRLRREDATLRAPAAVDGAVLDEEALAVRFFGEGDGSDDRLLLVNLGRQLALVPAPEPLLAPPAGRRWRVVWASEDPVYGGGGFLDPTQGARTLTGHAAILLAPEGAPARG
jgi:maltooligosyltrehalose trehalohydrolase